MTFRLPDSVRRAGAYLKAFALLEDHPSAALASPVAQRGEVVARGPGAGRDRRIAAPHAAPTTASHVHRRPPRTAVARIAPRRPGAPLPAVQPCRSPLSGSPQVRRVGRRAQHAPHS